MVTAPTVDREDLAARARDVIQRCRTLATYTEEPGFTTRTFLSPPMREVHADLREWMTRLGMEAWVDAAGNLRARASRRRRPTPRA